MKLTLITACFNAEATILTTLESVKNQVIDFPFEHIILDGASTDGTLAIIQENLPDFSTVSSEPDQGLYDALNKGWKKASGDFIGFLHADDVLAHSTVLKEIYSYFTNNPSCQAIYGDLSMVSSDLSKVVRRWKAGKKQSFILGWMPPHPTVYVKKEVYLTHGGYRTDHGSAADYEWMLRVFHFKKVPLHPLITTSIFHPLVLMRTGGMSTSGFSALRKAFLLDIRAWYVNKSPIGIFPVVLKKVRKFIQFI